MGKGKRGENGGIRVLSGEASGFFLVLDFKGGGGKPQVFSWYLISRVAGDLTHVTVPSQKLGSMPRSLIMGMPKMVLKVMSLPRPNEILNGSPS
jgi:hypothetical protein